MSQYQFSPPAAQLLLAALASPRLVSVHAFCSQAGCNQSSHSYFIYSHLFIIHWYSSFWCNLASLALAFCSLAGNKIPTHSYFVCVHLTRFPHLLLCNSFNVLRKEIKPFQKTLSNTRFWDQLNGCFWDFFIPWQIVCFTRALLSGWSLLCGGYRGMFTVASHRGRLAT